MKNKGCSAVKAIYPDGKLLMEDHWFCNAFNFLTTETAQLVVANMKEIKNVEIIEKPEWDNDFKKSINKQYSLITLCEPHEIKVGDVLYSHSILKTK